MKDSSLSKNDGKGMLSSERSGTASRRKVFGIARPPGRYLVIASIFLLSLVTYIDRAAISSAKGSMASDLALSDEAMGAVFGAFALGYSLAQIPAGWFADRIGPRFALSTVVTLWSLFTFLTGAVSRFGLLLVVRFMFGMAEAGAFPGSARTFYNWVPPKERGIANGLLFSGALLGGGLAFPFFAWLLSAYGWRSAFYILAIPGMAWVFCWLTWFRDHPREPVTQEAVTAGPEMTYGQVFRSWPMALAMIQYFAGNFTFYIGITWMLPYLKEQYELSDAAAANYSMIPLIGGAVANWMSGIIVDLLYRSRYRNWSRRLPAISGFILATAAVLAVDMADSAVTAVVAFTVATFGIELTISPSWAYCIDIGGKSSGAVSGTMNMAGNFAGFVSSNAFPYLQRITGSTAAYYRTAGVLNAVGIICWIWMRRRGHTTEEAG